LFVALGEIGAFEFELVVLRDEFIDADHEFLSGGFGGGFWKFMVEFELFKLFVLVALGREAAEGGPVVAGMGASGQCG
jgi:hypothetical protein